MRRRCPWRNLTCWRSCCLNMFKEYEQLPSTLPRKRRASAVFLRSFWGLLVYISMYTLFPPMLRAWHCMLRWPMWPCRANRPSGALPNNNWRACVRRSTRWAGSRGPRGHSVEIEVASKCDCWPQPKNEAFRNHQDWYWSARIQLDLFLKIFEAQNWTVGTLNAQQKPHV